MVYTSTDRLAMTDKVGDFLIETWRGMLISLFLFIAGFSVIAITTPDQHPSNLVSALVSGVGALFGLALMFVGIPCFMFGMWYRLSKLLH